MLSFQKLFFPLALIPIILLAYWDLPKTFFQQDEWWSLAGNIYYQSLGITGIIFSFFPGDAIAHFNPLAKAYAWVTYLLFYTDFKLYAWLSIVLHVFNALLLYHFILFWLRNRKIAFIASLFFAVNSIPSQAVTWVAAANSYEVPLAFILISLIFFHRFLEKEEHRKLNIILSLLIFFISLLFHENGIFLFLFYPIIFFLYAKSQVKKLLPTFSYGILIFMFIFFLIRIPFFFGLSVSLPLVTDVSHPPVTVYPYRLISIAMKSFAGSIFPEKTLIGISEGLVRIAYPQFITSDKVPNPFIAQSIVFDLILYVLTVLIICVIVLSMKLTKDKKIKDALFWSLIFVPASLLPYAFVLGKAGYASILEPKFLYVGSIGTSILIAIIVYLLLMKFSRQKMLRVFILLLFALYILSHISAVRMQIDNLEEIASERKKILNAIKTSYKKLPQKVIFYTQSDTAYYGMPDNEKILPMQVGFGKMLMIWYQKDERFPGCLYEGQFLLNLLEEGYRFCEGRGFGYFRDYGKLAQAIKTNYINSESIIAYSWNGNTKKFIDITQQIRNNFKKENL